jgi:hypothetical protein
MEIDTNARARRAARIIGLTLTACWAGFWALAGLPFLLLPFLGLSVDGVSAAAAPLAVAFLGIGLAPVVPWMVHLSRSRARRVAHAQAWRRMHAQTQTMRAEEQRLARLPASIRNEWRRLEHARDLVHGFAGEGWVEPAALLHVDDHMARLAQLLQADERVIRLGGTPSSTLARQVEELTALLVALADEAVEHQASLASDDPVPATLAEARERLANTTQALRDLQQPAVPSAMVAPSRAAERPQGARGLQQPG